MKTKKRLYLIIPVVIIVGLICWYFSSIIAYLLIATILSIMGQPLVRLFSKIKIGRFKMPNALSAFLTLLVIIAIFFGILRIFVPVLNHQAQIISTIDTETMSAGLQEPLHSLEGFLIQHNVITPDESLETIISTQLLALVKTIDISVILRNLISFTGRVFMAFFAIAFLTFFFLKEDRMLYRTIMLITPVEYQTEIKHIMIKSTRLLTRYFLGLCLDVLIIMTLITIGTSIIGVKNALIIGFFAGIMNVIPYLGPIIGAAIGVLLSITTNLQADFYTELMPMIAGILIVFVITNLIDAMILQPTIYSNTVKAHPVEIFLVILIGSSLAGIPGMILAIPSYTFIRIVAKTFLKENRFINKLTEKI